MSEFQQSVEVPYLLKHDNIEYTLPVLKLRDFGEMIARFKADQKAKLEAILSEEDELKSEQKAQFRANLITSPSPLDIMMWATTIEGGTEALKIALKRAGVANPKEVIDDLTPTQLLRAAMEVIDHPQADSKTVKKESDDKKDEEDGSPKS